MISIVKSNIPETLLKQVVGHSKAMDTGIYQHVVDGDAERASTIMKNVFDRLLNEYQSHFTAPDHLYGAFSYP